MRSKYSQLKTRLYFARKNLKKRLEPKLIEVEPGVFIKTA